jgi:protein required for attachment to host cells
MHRTCIAVVDATRARLFTLERTSDAQGLHEELVEQRDLVNPARRRRGSELFTDSHFFDDHRDASIDELDIVFARKIMDELTSLTREHAAQRIVVCASPKMLGKLRELAAPPLPIEMLDRDLVKLTPTQLREHLAEHGLLPPAPARRGLEQRA